MTVRAEWVEQAWQDSMAKLGRMTARIGDKFPHKSIDGLYDAERASWWTAGFWPGLLWLAYQETRDEKFAEVADSCERQLDEVLHGYYALDHDMGFMWSLSSVAQYKLKNNEDSKRRGLIAANMLAARFNPKGSFIRAWNNWSPSDDKTGWAIIDCTMNLPLLYWASETTGDPRFTHFAKLHADTVLEHFQRPDGSVYHIVRFDAKTGERVEALGGQGYAPESGWARGQSWALYGLTLSYMYTRDERYLQGAKRVAHYFMANLPEDKVPYWDFRLPTLEGMPRDSSAGAIAACGLLELAKLVPEHEARLYRTSGEDLVKALYEHCGTFSNPEEEGLLRHGTGHYPAGQNIDISLIYGDYYFVEALAKLRGQTEIFW